MSDLANFIPERCYPVSMEVALGNGVACDWINVGNAEMCWLVVHAYVAAAAAVVVTPLHAYAAAGTGTSVLTMTCPIWAGITIAGVPTPKLTRIAVDAVNHTTAATAGDHIVIMQIDPAGLGYEASTPSLGAYKYIGATVVSLVADYISVMLWILPRWGGTPVNQPSYVV